MRTTHAPAVGMDASVCGPLSTTRIHYRFDYWLVCRACPIDELFNKNCDYNNNKLTRTDDHQHV